MKSVGQCLTGHTYGFLGGLWHGFIAPFDLIGMLFSDEITMYAQNNNGGFYALGFILGSGGWGFLGGRGIQKSQKIILHNLLLLSRKGNVVILRIIVHKIISIFLDLRITK